MKVLLLCSWGGHLQELMELKDAWEPYDHTILTYASDRPLDGMGDLILLHPPWKGVVRYSWTLLKALTRMLFDRPDVMLSTGMGYTDVFVFPLCKLLGVYTVYIESAANVDHISGTGNVVRRFADRFLVQWEELADRIGAEYKGGAF